MDYPFKPAAIARMSFADLVDNKVSKPLPGHIVLISPSAAPLRDLKRLPVENRFPQFEHLGSVVMAYAIQSLLSGRTTQALPPLALTALLMAFCLLPMLVAEHWPRLGPLIFVLALSLYGFSKWAAFVKLQLYLPVTPLVLSLVCAWLALAGFGKPSSSR